MSNTLKNKLIGSLIFVFIIGGLSAVALNSAQGKFISTGNTLHFDGVVVAKTADTMTVVPDSTAPITVDVTPKTTFLPIVNFSAVEVGDVVEVTAKEAGATNPEAKIIKISAQQAGYGSQGGSQVIIKDATVVAKGGNSFIIQNNLSTTLIQVTTNTTFHKTTFGDLTAGDVVKIVGTDIGGIFTAKIVSNEN